MNNEKNFFVTDVEHNINEDEIILALPMELIEKAEDIAQKTKMIPALLLYLLPHQSKAHVTAVSARQTSA